MESRNTIVEELKDLYPAVANITRKNVYSAPLDYFDNLAGRILTLIKEKEDQFLPTSAAMPFGIPAGYFDSLTENILKKAKNSSTQSEVAEELDEIAPLLNTLSKQPVFSVPAGYFDNFKVFAPKEQKPGILKFIGNGNKLAKYAAAAVIAGIVTTGSFLFIKNEAPKETGTKMASSTFKQNQIDSLTDQEIIDYLNSYSSAVDLITTSTFDVIKEGFPGSSVKDMSEEEIKEYLKENEEPGELHSKEG
jgi:hypothetical protein